MSETEIKIKIPFVIPDKYDPEYDTFYPKIEGIRKQMEKDFGVLPRHFGIIPKIMFHLKDTDIDFGNYVSIDVEIPVFERCKELHSAIIAYCRKHKYPCATIAEKSVMEMLDKKKQE